MSYILDALQKAESERRMEAGDDLDPLAVPAADAPFARPANRQSRSWQPAVLLALVVVAAAAAGGWWFSRPSGAAPGQYAEQTTADRSVTTSPVAPSDAGQPEPPTSAPSIDATTKGPTPTILAAPVDASAPRTSETASVVAASVKRKGGARSASAAPASADNPGNASKTSDNHPPKPGTKPLPNFELGKGLPQLKISGATFSDNPSHRMIIVDGQVIKEGQQAAPGVIVEVIGARSAILKHGGKRYNINY